MGGQGLLLISNVEWRGFAAEILPRDIHRAPPNAKVEFSIAFGESVKSLRVR
jgi:hypothetical protein